MDARLIAVIERLSEDLYHLETALAGTRELIKTLAKEVRKNGKIQEKRLDTIQTMQRFLANQQPRRNGANLRWVENDDHD